MEFGSLFDSILTRGRKTLDDYAVADFSVPDAERKVLDALADICTCTQFGDISMEEVINVAESVRYRPNFKPQTRYDRIAKYSQHHGNPLKSSGFFRFLAFVAYLYEKECNFFQPFGPRFRLMDETAPEAEMLNL